MSIHCLAREVFRAPGIGRLQEAVALHLAQSCLKSLDMSLDAQLTLQAQREDHVL